MRFLVLGSVNIDMTYSLDHIVSPGETTTACSLQTGAGGKGANQAAALGKAGSDVFFAGKAGEDGRWVLDKLSGYGVDVSLTVVSPSVMTGQAMIQLDRNGQNSIILSPGGNRSFTESEIESILSGFGKGDAVILQNEVNHLSFMIEKARERGMTVCLNPSPYDSIIETLPLDEVDMFFVNEIEAGELAGLSARPRTDEEFRKAAEVLMERFPSASFVITAGRHGAYYAKGGESWFSPIVDLPAVDTTGAGDTFSGYFLASLYGGLSPKEALDKASRASALTVSRSGAMDSMPTMEEVEALEA